jgi:predicted RNA-binding Zn ribbon-like protein
MTGETAQPGGRAPAPGPLALVQAFLNTHYDLGAPHEAGDGRRDDRHGAEVWHSPDAYAEWLRARGLIADPATVDADELQRAIRARDALRALISGEDDGAWAALADAGQGAPVEVRFTAAGPAFAPNGSAASAVGLVLAHAAQAMSDGSWERLKICPGRDCGWAFFDHSRNGSGRWCSMSICGGREKARAHYRRSRGDL